MIDFVTLCLFRARELVSLAQSPTPNAAVDQIARALADQDKLRDLERRGLVPTNGSSDA